MQPELSRRSLLCAACAAGSLGLVGALRPSRARAAGTPKTTLSAGEALQRLKNGNADFLADKPRVPVQNHQRRLEIARSQTPFAVLVGCSDSRVPPEQLFGTSLGEMFIVRNAGNTVDTNALGSIEYGVLELGAPLVIVLGHERCGAVDAAVSVMQKNVQYSGSIGRMLESILPAVLQASRQTGLTREQLLRAAVYENVRRTVRRLRTSEPSLIEPLAAGTLRIVGAHYDLDTGEVDFSVA